MVRIVSERHSHISFEARDGSFSEPHATELARFHDRHASASTAFQAAIGRARANGRRTRVLLSREHPAAASHRFEAAVDTHEISINPVVSEAGEIHLGRTRARTQAARSDNARQSYIVETMNAATQAEFDELVRLDATGHFEQRAQAGDPAPPGTEALVVRYGLAAVLYAVAVERLEYDNDVHVNAIFDEINAREDGMFVTPFSHEPFGVHLAAQVMSPSRHFENLCAQYKGPD